MISNRLILKNELDDLQDRENEMYKLYSEIFLDMLDSSVKEKIKTIRDQELGHIQMVTEIISIPREDISIV